MFMFEKFSKSVFLVDLFSILKTVIAAIIPSLLLYGHKDKILYLYIAGTAMHFIASIFMIKVCKIAHIYSGLLAFLSEKMLFISACLCIIVQSGTNTILLPIHSIIFAEFLLLFIHIYSHSIHVAITVSIYTVFSTLMRSACIVNFIYKFIFIIQDSQVPSLNDHELYIVHALVLLCLFSIIVEHYTPLIRKYSPACKNF